MQTRSQRRNAAPKMNSEEVSQQHRNEQRPVDEDEVSEVTNQMAQVTIAEQPPTKTKKRHINEITGGHVPDQ
jgi:hypothetical protein